MAEEEKDPERRLRIGAMLKAMQEATDDHLVVDVQVALANFVSLMCLRADDPEHLFLLTQEYVSEVFRALRKNVRSGSSPPGLEGLN